jgi:hypothetical protein
MQLTNGNVIVERAMLKIFIPQRAQRTQRRFAEDTYTK